MGGGRRDRIRKYPYRLTVLILGRGDKLFRAELLSQVESLRIAEIIWVERSEVRYDLETLSRDFSDVRFLIPGEQASIGELIDIGISESRAPLVLCMWSDTRILSLSPTLLESLEKTGVLCSLPLIRNQRSEVIPSFQSPLLKKGRLSLQFRSPSRDGEDVLFPFDYCGIYNKERFIQTGGFDVLIRNPYWQKLDFGFRCHLWGERIRGTMGLTLLSTCPPPPEDATPDEGYKIFYLKNLAVRFRREMGVIPWRRILDYTVHSNTSPLFAVKEFRALRDWVELHRFRFRRDPRELIEKWGRV
jgi:hypothetical protein